MLVELIEPLASATAEKLTSTWDELRTTGRPELRRWTTCASTTL